MGSASASSLTSTPKNLDNFAARRLRAWNSDGAGDAGGAVAGLDSRAGMKLENGGGVWGTAGSCENGDKGKGNARDVGFVAGCSNPLTAGTELERIPLRPANGIGLMIGTEVTEACTTMSCP